MKWRVKSHIAFLNAALSTSLHGFFLLCSPVTIYVFISFKIGFLAPVLFSDIIEK